MPVDLPGLETLPHLIRRALEQPRDEAFVERVDGAWTAASSARALQRVENLACAIRDAGLAHGDRVALIAHDCIDWIISDFATFFAGCVVVPIFPTQALDHTEYILKHSDAKLLFIDTQASLQRLSDAKIALPRAVVFDSVASDSLHAFEARGAAVRVERPDLPGAYEAALKPDDLAVLIYTSGTTGDPKGVMLSHDNLGFDAQSSLAYGLSDFVPSENVLSVLPYSHIYEHTMIYIYLLSNTRYCICHDPNHLLEDLQDVHPTVMTCVPRIFDRVLAGVNGKAMAAGGLQAKLVPWALRVGREWAHAQNFEGGSNPLLAMQYAIAKRLVLDKVRKVLGLDKVRTLLSGSAALHIDVAMTYFGLGVNIMQGYGLTETSPVITASRPEDNRFGCVGKPIPGAEVKIAEDGEILARGRNIMQGYYRDPEATAAAIVDGWFHTGDIGEVDADGYLRITDRKKELFKTATGKYVAPARVEAAIKRSVFVSQAMVIGDGRPHPAALVCPNWDLVRMELNLSDGSPEELAARDDVETFVTAEVRKQTADLASYEQIRRVIVLPREFSIESGELSPSMKIKRRVVEDRYRATIDRAYAVDLHTHSHA
ncbi:MAG TPA: long-chain fatty acid--CoA ligase [Candidatus Baltobacteraceae bacterium]|nr:long-chain fatty acid--CoA ligase [Candidatus Baltobacteraceae bacterium]